jgi:hypothetical protein
MIDKFNFTDHKARCDIKFSLLYALNGGQLMASQNYRSSLTLINITAFLLVVVPPFAPQHINHIGSGLGLQITTTG